MIKEMLIQFFCTIGLCATCVYLWLVIGSIYESITSKIKLKKRNTTDLYTDVCNLNEAYQDLNNKFYNLNNIVEQHSLTLTSSTFQNAIQIVKNHDTRKTDN